MQPTPPPIDALLQEASWLRRLALHLVGDADTAEDLVQETLTVAARRGAAQDIEAPRAWLAGSLRNILLRRRRDERHRGDREVAWGDAQPTDAESTTDISERMELQSIVGEELARLREPYRTLLFQHYYEQKRLEEIARELDVPAGTIRARAKRGRDLLRAALVARDGRTWSEWSAALAPVAGLAPTLGARSVEVAALHAATKVGLPTIALLAGAAAMIAVAGWLALRSPGAGVERGSTPQLELASALEAGRQAPPAPLEQIEAEAPFQRQPAATISAPAAAPESVLAGGRIVSVGGWTDRALEGAHVEFHGSEGRVIQAKVNERTWASTTLTPGPWTVRAWAHGHALLERPLTVDASAMYREDVELIAIGSVPVRIENLAGRSLIDQYLQGGGYRTPIWVLASARPIPDRVERPHSWGTGEHAESVWVQSNHARFQVRGLDAHHAGELRLGVAGELHAALLFGEHVLARGRVRGSDRELVLRAAHERLTAGLGTVRFRTVDAASGMPIESASCSARSHSLRYPVYGTSDADGWVEFQVPPGKTRLSVERRDLPDGAPCIVNQEINVPYGATALVDELRWPTRLERGFDANWTAEVD